MNSKGFTLVELAIVMIIIGLLIGGVLKGQELIANSQVTSTIAQIKGIDAAASTFKDQYKAVPGDMNRATVLLSNCAAPSCINGNGNGRLQSAASPPATNSGESIQFWMHMSKANLFAGVNGTLTPAWGEGLPAADVGGGFTVGYERGPSFTNIIGSSGVRGGHWMALKANPAMAAASTGHLRASIAARIDRKIDNGYPATGVVHATNSGGAPCWDGTGPTATYRELDDTMACGLLIRLSN